MKIVILNGSPKGEDSVTMQYIAYIGKKFPDHSYDILNVAHEIKRIGKDITAWEGIIGSIRSADLVVWAFPLYYLLVSSQYKRFIELVFERKEGGVFAGKYAASLSTSIHFFDQTAHAYIHAVSDDLGMKYLESFSADMYDLLQEEEQERLEKFASLILTAVERNAPVQREYSPKDPLSITYIPGTEERSTRTGGRNVLILTDDDGSSPNLTAMNTRLRNSFSDQVQFFNIRELDIRGGCLGCCRCGYDNTCVYTDGYVDFYKNVLQSAEIIIMSGSVHDRYLSSAWKQFFDRSFFKGHTPGLKGKQIGFVISGPLRQIPCLKEALAGWADNGGCHAHFLTDEVEDSAELDALLDALAGRLVQAADLSYIPPPLFYAVGGHKIFRDNIYAGMRFVFQADYRYYCEHGMFDFPQADLKTRLMNMVFMTVTRIPGFRKKVFADIKQNMIAPFRTVLTSV